MKQQKTKRAARSLKRDQSHVAPGPAPKFGAGASYRPDIDGLRALAVLAVIAFHANSRFMPGGFIGVDVFFVISGYLISGILLRGLESGSFSVRDFYAKRVRRIFPALILVLISVEILGWFFLLPDEYASLGRTAYAGVLFVANFSLWRDTGYFDAAATLKPLLHLWSLGVEEQFYIVWPFCLALALKRRVNLFWLMASLAFASLLFNLLRVENHEASTFFLPLTRLWELMAGSVLIFAERRLAQKRTVPFFRTFVATKRKMPTGFLSLSGFLLLGTSLVFFKEQQPYPGWRALLPVMGTLLIIGSGPKAWLNGRILSHPIPVFIGLISYPLYLWHWPLLSVARIITIGSLSPAVTLGILLLSLVLAWFTFEAIEKPSQLLFQRTRSGFVAGAFCLMAVIGLAGAAIKYTNGFPERFPEISSFETFSASEQSLDWRRDKCFLLPESPGGPTSAFDKNDCATVPSDGKPSLLLIGDSHAASLYSGLNKAFREDVHIGQLTSGFCVPMIENVAAVNIKDGTARCHEINTYVFRRIRELRPTLVVFSANYFTYDTDKLWAYPNFLNEMTKNINRLAEDGIKIIVVGQTPTWVAPLPKLVERLLLNRQPVPERSTIGLDPAATNTDRKMEQIAWSPGVRYVSLTKTLCTNDGCLLRTGPRLPLDLLMIDTGHLSENGQNYVVQQILSPAIVEALKHTERP